MGLYIQGPTQGKAAYILSEYGGERINLKDDWTWDCYAMKLIRNVGRTLVCVVDNGGFEAAAVCPNEREFKVFNNPADFRFKTWLAVPTKALPDYLGKAKSSGR